MRYILGLALACTLSCGTSMADEKSKPVDSDMARLKNQAEAVKNEKLNQAEAKAKQEKAEASRSKEAVDRQLHQVQTEVKKKEANTSSLVNPSGTDHHASVQSHQAHAEAKAKKERIEADAQARAEAHRATANQKAEIIDKSVEGLESQVGTKGQFGLQKKGTSLHVRHYGTNH